MLSSYLRTFGPAVKSTAKRANLENDSHSVQGMRKQDRSMNICLTTHAASKGGLTSSPVPLFLPLFFSQALSTPDAAQGPGPAHHVKGHIHGTVALTGMLPHGGLQDMHLGSALLFMVNVANPSITSLVMILLLCAVHSSTTSSVTLTITYNDGSTWLLGCLVMNGWRKCAFLEFLIFLPSPLLIYSLTFSLCMMLDPLRKRLCILYIDTVPRSFHRATAQTCMSVL